jgi:hypothetical protein
MNRGRLWGYNGVGGSLSIGCASEHLLVQTLFPLLVVIWAWRTASFWRFICTWDSSIWSPVILSHSLSGAARSEHRYPSSYH